MYIYMCGSIDIKKYYCNLYFVNNYNCIVLNFIGLLL